MNAATEGISELDLRRRSAERHRDLPQAGVKGHFPLVLLGSVMVGGQQVDLQGLDRLLHPLQNLQGGGKHSDCHPSPRSGWGAGSGPLRAALCLSAQTNSSKEIFFLSFFFPQNKGKVKRLNCQADNTQFSALWSVYSQKRVWQCHIFHES